VAVVVGILVLFVVSVTASDPESTMRSLTKFVGFIGLALWAAYQVFKPRRKKS
jgi:hypothetical protein